MSEKCSRGQLDEIDAKFKKKKNTPKVFPSSILKRDFSYQSKIILNLLNENIHGEQKLKVGGEHCAFFSLKT